MIRTIRYQELWQDAQALVDYLNCTSAVSDDTRATCRAALLIFMGTCTPAESVDEFEDVIEAVKSLIESEARE